MNKLTDDLNIIQNLPDQPTLTPQELKACFDKAGNIIKSYLNEVVEPKVTQIEGEYVSDDDLAEYKETIKKGLEETTENLKEQIDSAISNTTGYGDFEITQTDSVDLNHGNGSVKTDTREITKEGYYPIGIVGFELSGVITPTYTATQPVMLSNFLTNRSVGKCNTNVKILFANNSNWTYKSTYRLHILWVKVKS